MSDPTTRATVKQKKPQTLLIEAAALITTLRREADHLDTVTGVPCQSENAWHAKDYRRWAQCITDLVEHVSVRAEQGWQPSWDLIAHLERQRDFSLRTFGPGHRTQGVCDHIRKELAEIEAEPLELSEWVDVILLALDGAWRAGHSSLAIAQGIAAKQAKNEQRQWPDWRTADPNQAITHVKAPPVRSASTKETA